MSIKNCLVGMVCFISVIVCGAYDQPNEAESLGAVEAFYVQLESGESLAIEEDSYGFAENIIGVDLLNSMICMTAGYMHKSGSWAKEPPKISFLWELILMNKELFTLPNSEQTVSFYNDPFRSKVVVIQTPKKRSSKDFFTLNPVMKVIDFEVNQSAFCIGVSPMDSSINAVGLPALLGFTLVDKVVTSGGVEKRIKTYSFPQEKWEELQKYMDSKGLKY